jgi:hypothetical protein
MESTQVKQSAKQLPKEESGVNGASPAAGLSRRENEPSTSEWGTSAFVWGTWALTLLVALAYVVIYGYNVPYHDEWSLVPALTGQQPVTASWLWAEHNGHRIPLSKLVMLAFLKSTNYDFRSGMYFNLCCLGACSLAMLLGIRSLRGRLSYSDGFFPLVLLHLGHATNLVWSWQLCMFLPMLFVAILLLLIVRRKSDFTAGQALLAGVCLALLPLCAGMGPLLVPPLGLWFGYAAVRQWRRPKLPNNKFPGLLLLVFVVAAFLEVGLYMIDLPTQPAGSNTAVPVALAPFLKTSLGFLTMSFGTAGNQFWPLSGLGLLILLLLTTALLFRYLHKQPQDRLRAGGLLLFLGAMLTLALGTGWTRSYVPIAGLTPRYVILAAPILCCIYFIWEVCGRPRFRAFVQMCLFSLMCMLYGVNGLQALERAAWHSRIMKDFERSQRAGEPPFILAERYAPGLYPWSEEYLASCLRALHQAGVGRFRPLRDDPEVREVSLPVILKEPQSGPNVPEVVLPVTLKERCFVYAIRVKYTSRTPVDFQVSWLRKDKNGVVEVERKTELPGKGLPAAEGNAHRKERLVTIWVNDEIDEFRLLPDEEHGPFRISEIVLLTPPTNGPGAAKTDKR